MAKADLSKWLNDPRVPPKMKEHLKDMQASIESSKAKLDERKAEVQPESATSSKPQRLRGITPGPMVMMPPRE